MSTCRSSQATPAPCTPCPPAHAATSFSAPRWTRPSTSGTYTTCCWCKLSTGTRPVPTRCCGQSHPADVFIQSVLLSLNRHHGLLLSGSADKTVKVLQVRNPTRSIHISIAAGLQAVQRAHLRSGQRKEEQRVGGPPGMLGRSQPASAHHALGRSLNFPLFPLSCLTPCCSGQQGSDASPGAEGAAGKHRLKRINCDRWCSCRVVSPDICQDNESIIIYCVCTPRSVQGLASCPCTRIPLWGAGPHLSRGAAWDQF